MTTERRRAPRRKITQIDKTGTWGKVEYRHLLSCGHVETRKRIAPSDEIACTWCLRAEAKEKEIRSLVAAQPRTLITVDSEAMDDEVAIERARSTIAARFGIPVDAVDVASEDFNGRLIIRNATIYLSANDVQKLLKPR